MSLRMAIFSRLDVILILAVSNNKILTTSANCDGLIFQGNDGIRAYDEYCQPWKVSLELIPSGYKQKMCHTICEPTGSTCMYYTYIPDTQTCVFCVRSIQSLFLPTVGSELELASNPSVSSVQSRQGPILGCNILTLGCSTGWLVGNTGGTRRMMDILGTVTAIQFCQDGSYPQYFGFTLFVDDVPQTRVACPQIGHAHEIVNFSPNDPLSEFFIYHNEEYVTAMSVGTSSGRIYGPFGFQHSDQDEMCRFHGNGLKRLTMNAGHGIDAIQFEFTTCE